MMQSFNSFVPFNGTVHMQMTLLGCSIITSMLTRERAITTSITTCLINLILWWKCISKMVTDIESDGFSFLLRKLNRAHCILYTHVTVRHRTEENWIIHCVIELCLTEQQQQQLGHLNERTMNVESLTFCLKCFLPRRILLSYSRV
jgi:hypothetical protein